MPAGKLLALFDEERKALASGDLNQLKTVAQSKEQVMQRVAQAGVDRVDLERLRIAATRNDALLAAHAAGLRAAISRIDTLSSPGNPFTSYDKSGAAQAIGPSSPDFERRS